VRCRSLLWFSMDDVYKNYPVSKGTANVDKLDKNVEYELEKFVEGPVQRKVKEAKQEMALWMAAEEIIQDRRFASEEQSKFRKMFGKELLEKMKRFLANSHRQRVLKDVKHRASSSRERLQKMMPSTFESGYKKVCKEIEKRVSKHFR